MSNARTKSVPDIVVGRLPVYLRALDGMRASGQEVTSSHALAEWLGISPAQLRKDLSHFGGFGKQGTGYHIASLQSQLRSILNLDHEWPLMVVGAGHIGSAIASYPGFSERGFRVVAIFDADPAKIGLTVGGHAVRAISELPDLARRLAIRHAMLAVPAEHAQAVADLVVAAGVTAILNYAPIHLAVPRQVRVQYIDPVLHLQQMTYYL
jgi:redox-sensing transcriptional repressor